MTTIASESASLDEQTDKYDPLYGPSAPPISVDLGLDSAVYSISKSKDVPSLLVTMTSHFMHPITIRTFGTIMEERTAWRYRSLLSVTNMSTGNDVIMPSETRCRGCGVSPRGYDKVYYTTLPPEVPITVAHPLNRVTRWRDRNPERPLTYRTRDGKIEQHHYFEPGCDYNVGLKYGLLHDSTLEIRYVGPYQMYFWWRYGPKEDIMIPESVPAKDWAPWEVSEPRIRIGGIPDVVLRIVK